MKDTVMARMAVATKIHPNRPSLRHIRNQSASVETKRIIESEDIRRKEITRGESESMIDITIGVRKRNPTLKHLTMLAKTMLRLFQSYRTIIQLLENLNDQAQRMTRKNHRRRGGNVIVAITAVIDTGRRSRLEAVKTAAKTESSHSHS